jgi:hypothetical protein
MKFFTILLGAAAAGSALAAPAGDVPTPTTKTTKRASKFQFVGVNQSGAEFGQNTLPGQLGKHYTWPAKSSIDVSCLTFKLPCSHKAWRENDGKDANREIHLDIDWQGDEHVPDSHHDARTLPLP